MLAFERLSTAFLQPSEKLVVDFTNAASVDSGIITALIDVAGRARAQAIQLQLVVRPGTHVHNVLELLGILDRLDTTERLDLSYLPETPAPPAEHHRSVARRI